MSRMAIEHELTLYSADTDFARFRELRWENPIR
jgi:predicted nucleic acid-binding protein